MKKVFNLSVILAVLASALTFTSCGDDDDDATIDFIKAEGQNAWTINAEAGIESIELYAVNGDESEYLKEISEGITKEAKGKTTYLLKDLEAGTYKVNVTDKDGLKKEKTIEVGAGADVELNWVDEIEVSNGDLVYYKNADGQGEIYVVMANEASITVQINGGKAVTISDAGESYILPDGSTSGINALKDKWETAQILVAKVMEKSMLAGGNGASLNTKFATNAAQLAK
ncbi:MAG: hypothetical protein UF067_06880 [Paludibacteraceae bacterium]|nr:hypothetical protein [Paludibacteraceae bacterium]